MRVPERVSAVVVTPAGAAESLGVALAALAEQGHSDLEILVAPYDGSASTAVREVARARSDVTVVPAASSANLAVAEALKVASGAHLWIIEAGTVPVAGAITRLLEAAAPQHPVVRARGGAVTDCLFSVPPEPTPSHGDFLDALATRAPAPRVDGVIWRPNPHLARAPGPALRPGFAVPMADWSDHAEPWLTLVGHVLADLGGPERSAWIIDQLSHRVPSLLADAERLPEETVDAIGRACARLWADLPTNGLLQVPVPARAAAWLAAQGSWRAVWRYLAAGATRPDTVSARPGRGRLWATFAEPALAEAPPVVAEVGGAESPLLIDLLRARWTLEEAGPEFEVDLRLRVPYLSFEPAHVSALWSDGTREIPARVHATLRGGVGAVTVGVPLAELDLGEWQLQVACRREGVERVSARVTPDQLGSAGVLRPVADGSAQPVFDDDRLVLLVGRERSFCVDEVHGPRATQAALRGRQLMIDIPGAEGAVRLTGPGVEVLGSLVEEPSTYGFALDDDGRALPNGSYRLLAGGRAIRWDPASADGLRRFVNAAEHRVCIRRGPAGHVEIDLALPLDRARARVRGEEPLLDQVLFTEHDAGGRNLAPLARRTADRWPGLRRLWTVRDHHEDAPSGTLPVVAGSAAWERARARSRWLIESGLPAGLEEGAVVPFVRRGGQRFLQVTSYPATSIAADRWRALNFSPSRIRALVAATSAQWTDLVLPDVAAEGLFRDVFEYRGRVLPSGLPSSDDVVAAIESREAAREQWGLDSACAVFVGVGELRPVTSGRGAQPLDVERLAQRLGPGFELLVCGREAPDLPRVRAVPAEMAVTALAAADCIVVGYDALRYDAALTGRPMIFHAPDAEVWAGSSAGFSLPFGQTAPGPIFTDTDDIAVALRDLDRIGRRHAVPLARFNATFNPLADGHAAERIVERFFGSAGALPVAAVAGGRPSRRAAVTHLRVLSGGAR